MKTPPHDATESRTGSTRSFWLGYLFGGVVGAGLGLIMGDLIGWIYMAGTCGSIAGLAFDRSSN